MMKKGHIIKTKILLRHFWGRFKDYIFSSIRLIKLRGQYPTSNFYSGVCVDIDSKLGKFNVLFENVEVMSSSIGDHTYVQKNSIIINSEIGKFCSIAMGVCIGLGQHSVSYVSSHPAFYLVNNPLAKTFSDVDNFVTSKRTYIGHDVWIGRNAMVKDGVRIGTGAVIAAGAVVTKDIPEYSIVGGVPAAIIRYRFDEKTRAKLLATNWWDKSDLWLRRHVALFLDPQKFLAEWEKN